ncbi:hypothetical protein [Caldanaerobacter subterraneus]|nr:hypothetical protein [Caldanaerobacter subterraneus]
MLKRVLVFILVLALAIPAVQFNFGSGEKKVYALLGNFQTVTTDFFWESIFSDNYYNILYDTDGTIYLLKDGSHDFFMFKDNGTYYKHVEGWMANYSFTGALDNGIVWTLSQNLNSSSDDYKEIYLGKILPDGSFNFYTTRISNFYSDVVQRMFFDYDHNAYMIVYSESDNKPYIRQLDLTKGNIIKSWSLPEGIGKIIKVKKSNKIYLISSYNIYTFDGNSVNKITSLPDWSYNAKYAYIDPDGNFYYISPYGDSNTQSPVYKYDFSSNSWKQIYKTVARANFATFNIPGIMLYSVLEKGVYMTNFVDTVQLISGYNSPLANSKGNIFVNGTAYYSGIPFNNKGILKYNMAYNFSVKDASTYSFNTIFDLPGAYNAVLQRSTDGVNFSDLININSNITTDNYALGNVKNYYRIKYFTSDGTNIYANYSNVFAIDPLQTLVPSVSSYGGLTWSKDTVNRGTGYVVLNWPSIKNATGYKVWVFDGYQYRAFDVGNTTTWDSRVWRIWPDMNWLNSQGDNTISTDVFNHIQGGGQLPDDPNLLYRKTVGTTYDNAHNYWFRVSAYNQYCESPMSDAVMPTLPNMTDPNPPVITSFTINDGAAKTGSPQLKLSISASDTGGSGLSKIEISTDNFQTIQQTVNISPIGTNPTIGPSTYSTTINNFQVPATPGTISVYVRAWDVAGNVSSVQKAQIALMNDVTPPTAQLKINNGAEFTTNPNVTLYITAYDDWTPIDQLLMRLSNDGKNWTPWSPLALTMNWTLDSSTQGYKTVFLQVQDASANIGTTAAGILYSTDPNVIRGTQTDTEPPKIDYLGLARGATVTTSYTPTITIVASDNVTPQNQLHVYASADGVNWVDLGYLTSANKTLPSGLVQNGYNIIQIKVVDGSFNETIKTLSFFKL